MNNSFFNKFLPKEPKFFPLLKEISGVLIATSDLIIECVQCCNHESAVDFFKRIKEEERKADMISNQIFDELNVTFITPFDREDIHHLASKLDDVIDDINSCAKRIALYNPKQIPEDAIKLANYLKEAALCIDKAIDELDALKKSSTKIKKYCNDLHTIENKADDVYDQFLSNIFENEKDAIEIIKMKEIMYELEKAIDTAEYVGKIIKTIIVKYA